MEPAQIPVYDLPPTPLTAAEVLARVWAHPEGCEWLLDFGWTKGSPEAIGAVHLLDAPQLLKVLTLGELLAFWCASTVSSGLCDWVYHNHPVVYKVRNSHWRYGWTNHWPSLVAHLHCLTRLPHLLPPGFTVALTWSTWFNEYGPSAHLRGPNPKDNLFLDAPFGLLIYHKGRHVLTIGFALCDRGVLVAQVQLREKSGNRWLYKLPRHYLDWALDLFAGAFPKDKLHLAGGASVVNAVRAAYGSMPCTMTPETEARITAFYDRPLGSYVRKGKAVGAYGREFFPLKSMVLVTTAA